MLDFITKWGSFDVFQSRASFFYEVEHLFLLQSGGRGITKYDIYYKVDKSLLQRRAVPASYCV